MTRPSTRSRAFFSATSRTCRRFRASGVLGDSRREPDIGGADGGAIGHDDGTLDHVLEFPHVTRPRIGGDRLDRVGKKRHRGPLLLGSELAGKAVGKQRGITLPFAQRRDLDNDLRKAIVQVLAELALLDVRLEALVGRADDPHVDRDLLAPADALDHALLQEAQELRLQRDRKIADFVEEQRTAVGGLDLAQRLLGGPGERPLLVAEELALEQGVRNRRAVDRDEALFPARREIVQRPGEELLARPRFTEDQDRCGRRRDLLDRAADAQHRRITGDDARHRRRFLHCLQPLVLRLQVVDAECPVDRPGQELGLERLGAEIMRAETDRLQGVRTVVLSGQHDHLGRRGERADLLQQPQTLGRIVGMGRQAQVHRDNGRLIPAQLGNRALPVAGDDRLVLVERPLHLLLERGVVLDDQQGSALVGHAADSLTAGVQRVRRPRSGRASAAAAPDQGRRRKTRVPTPGSLSTAMLPPKPDTYCELS